MTALEKVRDELADLLETAEWLVSRERNGEDIRKDASKFFRVVNLTQVTP